MPWRICDGKNGNHIIGYTTSENYIGKELYSPPVYLNTINDYDSCNNIQFNYCPICGAEIDVSLRPTRRHYQLSPRQEQIEEEILEIRRERDRKIRERQEQRDKRVNEFKKRLKFIMKPISYIWRYVSGKDIKKQK